MAFYFALFNVSNIRLNEVISRRHKRDKLDKYQSKNIEKSKKVDSFDNLAMLAEMANANKQDFDDLSKFEEKTKRYSLDYQQKSDECEQRRESQSSVSKVAFLNDQSSLNKERICGVIVEEELNNVKEKSKNEKYFLEHSRPQSKEKSSLMGTACLKKEKRKSQETSEENIEKSLLGISNQHLPFFLSEPRKRCHIVVLHPQEEDINRSWSDFSPFSSANKNDKREEWRQNKQNEMKVKMKHECDGENDELTMMINDPQSESGSIILNNDQKSASLREDVEFDSESLGKSTEMVTKPIRSATDRVRKVNESLIDLITIGSSKYRHYQFSYRNPGFALAGVKSPRSCKKNPGEIGQFRQFDEIIDD